MSLPCFHLAFPVHDLDLARKFYVNILGCKIGRYTDSWVDFDFFDNQITAHLKPNECYVIPTNEVNGKHVPVRHFGIIFRWSEWNSMVKDLKNKEISFYIDPYIRFKGETGEQGTFFVSDPSNNMLEFKSFKNENQLFKR